MSETNREKYEGATFGTWVAYYREDQRCWRVIDSIHSIICDVTGPQAEGRAALIADAPELLRQRDEALEDLKRFDQAALELRTALIENWKLESADDFASVNLYAIALTAGLVRNWGANAPANFEISNLDLAHQGKWSIIIQREDGKPPNVLIEEARAQRDALLVICERFCQRVEAGEIRSKATYAEMKAAIAAAKGGA